LTSRYASNALFIATVPDEGGDKKSYALLRTQDVAATSLAKYSAYDTRKTKIKRKKLLLHWEKTSAVNKPESITPDKYYNGKEHFEPGTKFRFPESVEYSTDGIVSKRVIDRPAGSVTCSPLTKARGLARIRRLLMPWRRS